MTQGNLRVEGGHRAFGEYLQREPRPTAVLAANDLTAIGFLLAAQDHGLQLPRDLSIVGLDDIDLASKVTPPLTTISLPRYEIGVLAMRMLLETIDNPARSNQQQEVATRLVVRKSTAPVAENN
jgi:LacI family transcriptional regulator